MPNVFIGSSRPNTRDHLSPFLFRCHVTSSPPLPPRPPCATFPLPTPSRAIHSNEICYPSTSALFGRANCLVRRRQSRSPYPLHPHPNPRRFFPLIEIRSHRPPSRRTGIYPSRDILLRRTSRLRVGGPERHAPEGASQIC